MTARWCEVLAAAFDFSRDSLEESSKRSPARDIWPASATDKENSLSEAACWSGSAGLEVLGNVLAT
jgi:hypothetical protein